jgi:hypothetical protein
MDTNLNALVARQQIAERITPPRSVPRQRRRTTISDKLKRVGHRLDN